MIAEGIKRPLERMSSTQQVVHDDSHTPNVHFEVVGPPGPDLGSHVDRCAAVSRQHLIGQDLTYAKVSNLEDSLF